MSETVGLTAGLPGHIGPGLIIGGKYRLEEEIGKGSMGTVYRAVHVTLGQRVAIKLISGEHLQSVEARKRFSVEAKAAAKLRSRHVVQVYDDGETPEGNPYIVLEYLDGETLEQRLEREQRTISLRDTELVR
ncbi:MAG TPA: protein kinase, partial [Polyangiaceae bacterium]|nr:protein kinase [Polyangiaceae bacterium]